MDRPISSSHLSNQLDKLIQELRIYPIFPATEVIQERDVPPSDFSYFGQFLHRNIDYRSLLLQAQPTLSDCKAIFEPDFYKDVFDYYSLEFKSLLYSDRAVNDLSEYDTYDKTSTTYDDLKNNNHELPGGMNALTKNFAVKSYTRFYSVRFRRK